MNYSFLKGVRKAAFNLLIVGAPLLIQLLPAEWMNLTVSGIVLLVVNFFKVQLNGSSGEITNLS